MLSGVAQGGLMPTLNTQFVLALPHGYRARAFGVMQQGLQVTQGGAVVLTGAIANRYSVPAVVGVWSVAGVALMLLLAARWPGARPETDPPAAPVRPGAHRSNAHHTQPRVSGAAGRMDG